MLNSAVILLILFNFNCIYGEIHMANVLLPLSPTDMNASMQKVVANPSHGQPSLSSTYNDQINLALLENIPRMRILEAETAFEKTQTFKGKNITFNGEKENLLDSVIQAFRDLLQLMDKKQVAEATQLVYLEGVRHYDTRAGGCGYNGYDRLIVCSSSPSNPDFLSLLSHEATHGWQFVTCEYDAHTAENQHKSFSLFHAFMIFINIFHQHKDSVTNGWLKNEDGTELLKWDLYALQNKDEWIAEIFANWVTGFVDIRSSSNVWTAITKGKAYEGKGFVEYAECLWKQNKGLPQCFQENLYSGNYEDIYPQHFPWTDVPTYEGLTKRQSQAIWNVCAHSAIVASHHHHAMHSPRTSGDEEIFNTLIRKVAPHLASVPSRIYTLGIGDCNHDGVLDWVCWYNGGTTVGNKKYMWNEHNKNGTYTFFASGNNNKNIDMFMKDPYVDFRNGGSIMQPRFREWQSPQFGSCNGAEAINHGANAHWFGYIVNHITGKKVDIAKDDEIIDEEPGQFYEEQNWPETELESNAPTAAPTTAAPTATTVAAEFGDLRLTTYPRGRLQIVGDDGQWHDLCGHWFWDNGDVGAEAACKKMGYETGKFYKMEGQNYMDTDPMYVGKCDEGQAPGFCTGACCSGGCPRNAIGCGNCNRGTAAVVEIECSSLISTVGNNGSCLCGNDIFDGSAIPTGWAKCQTLLDVDNLCSKPSDMNHARPYCCSKTTQPAAYTAAPCYCTCHGNNYVTDDRNDPPNDCWIKDFGYDKPCC